MCAHSMHNGLRQCTVQLAEHAHLQDSAQCSWAEREAAV